MPVIEVIDETPLVRDALSARLRAAGFDAVGRAPADPPSDPATVVLAGLDPDPIVLAASRRDRPTGPIVAFSRIVVPDRVRAALAAGVRGWVDATQGETELVEVLRRLHAGAAIAVCPSTEHALARTASGPTPRLSRREREVLALVAQGATNPVIAARLGVSVQTVKTHLARTFRKLVVRSRAEAVAVAIGRGELPGESPP